jgi:hypothetical protein
LFEQPVNEIDGSIDPGRRDFAFGDRHVIRSPLRNKVCRAALR